MYGLPSAFSSFFSLLSLYKIQLLAKQALVNQIEETDATEWKKIPQTYNIQKSKPNLEIEPYKILKVKDFALQYQLLSQEIILNQ